MQHFSSERTVRAKNEWIRPQHRPLQAVTKRGVALPGGWAEPRPGYSASPVAESTRTHSVFLGWLPWRAKAGYGTERFPSTDTALGWGKDRTTWYSDFLLTGKFGCVLWETRRIELGKGRKWVQAPQAGAPQRPPSPAAVKVTSEKDPGSTARRGRQGQQHGKPKTNVGGTVISLTDLPGPWVLGA